MTMVGESWQWTGNSSGSFSFKTYWDLTRNKFPDWPYFSLIWFPNHCPKMSLHLLRALHGKLRTKHILKGIGVIQEDTCQLCHLSVETLEHLFFQCPFSAYIWTLCRLKLGMVSPIGNLHEEAAKNSALFQRKSNISIVAKLVFSAAIWHIWRECNVKIFQGVSKHKLQVFKELYECISIPTQQCIWKTTTHETSKFILCNWGFSTSMGVINELCIVTSYQSSGACVDLGVRVCIRTV